MNVIQRRADEKSDRARRGWAPALMLFFLAPLVGEFLLGNLPITWLWTLVVLAPMYGGGAVLIRETARRLRLGWPGILLLGLAYAVIEEAFVTQSLFNPNYVGLRLLDYGYLAAFGIGSWWTVFVLSIHVIWSTATPIALTEAFSSERRHDRWLGKVGLLVIALLFAFGCVASAMAPSEDPFRASAVQMVTSAVVVVTLTIAAFGIGRRWERARPKAIFRETSPPTPATVGLVALVLGSVFMSLAIVFDSIPAPVNVVCMLLLLGLGLLLLTQWSASQGWTSRHELAFASGVLCVYLWYGFTQLPSVGEVSPLVDTVGNAVFAAAALLLLWFVWRRVESASVR